MVLLSRTWADVLSKTGIVVLLLSTFDVAESLVTVEFCYVLSVVLSYVVVELSTTGRLVESTADVELSTWAEESVDEVELSIVVELSDVGEEVSTDVVLLLSVEEVVLSDWEMGFNESMTGWFILVL